MAWGSLTFSLALLFLAMAVHLIIRSRNLRKDSGLPSGKVIYTDNETWFPNGESLHSSKFRLVGRPDYLVQQRSGEIIPVEVKSRMAPINPWQGHILQLAAYCLLVDETYGRRPSYGIVQYKDRAFAVDYSKELENSLLDLLADMRHDYQVSNLDRDHNDVRRCKSCGFREKCNQTLALA